MNGYITFTGQKSYFYCLTDNYFMHTEEMTKPVKTLIFPHYWPCPTHKESGETKKSIWTLRQILPTGTIRDHNFLKDRILVIENQNDLQNLQT